MSMEMYEDLKLPPFLYVFFPVETVLEFLEASANIFQKRSGGKDVTAATIATVSFWENHQMISMHENKEDIAVS